MLTDDELQELAIAIVEWKKLGLRLGFSDPELEEINQANDKLSEKAYAMLTRWKQREGSSATYKALCEALTHKFVQRQDLAEQFYRINGNYFLQCLMGLQ